MNRFSTETSPYLLQHAKNPVHWYSWGNEALSRAKDENRIILLSVGYSAFHWCHAMAHESFQAPAIAEVMNEHFINIKVDRGERPALDKIYQAAHYMLTESGGGSPLTMFLTPDEQIPFVGGSYVPPQPRYGIPALTEVLKKVASYYQDNTQQIRQQNQTLMQHMQNNWSDITLGETLRPE